MSQEIKQGEQGMHTHQLKDMLGLFAAHMSSSTQSEGAYVVVSSETSRPNEALSAFQPSCTVQPVKVTIGVSAERLLKNLRGKQVVH